MFRQLDTPIQEPMQTIAKVLRCGPYHCTIMVLLDVEARQDFMALKAPSLSPHRFLYVKSLLGPIEAYENLQFTARDNHETFCDF